MLEICERKRFRCLRLKAMCLVMAVLFSFSLGLVGCSEETGTTSLSEFYVWLGDNEDMPFEVSDKAQTFLDAHESFFPTDDRRQVSTYIDTSLEYRQIEKNPAQYGDQLWELPELGVLSVSETEVTGGFFTEIQAYDADDHIYYILYSGSIAIYADDVISAIVLPLGITNYENIGGGTTIALVTVGSYIEKI